MFVIPSLISTSLLCALSIFLYSGLGEWLKLKFRYWLPFSLGLIGISSTFLLYSAAGLCVYVDWLLLIFGAGGWIKIMWRKRHEMHLMRLVDAKYELLLFAIALLCSLRLNSAMLPSKLFSLDGNTFISNYHPDVFFRASTVAEIFHANYLGRILNPLYFPYHLVTYHIGGDGVVAAAQVLLGSVNVISYSCAQFVIVVIAVLWLLLQTGTSKQNFVAQLAAILAASLIFVILSRYGNYDSFTTLWHLNSPNFYGSLFCLASVIAFRDRHSPLALFFIWCSACFKISMIPVSLAATPFILLLGNKEKLPRLARYAIFPFACFCFLALLSRLDSRFTTIGSGLRLNFAFDLGDLRRWSMQYWVNSWEHFIAPLSQKLGIPDVNSLAIFDVLATPTFIAACLLLIIPKANPSDPKDRKQFMFTVLFGTAVALAGSLSFLVFKTITPHDEVCSLDPWIVNIKMVMILLPFLWGYAWHQFLCEIIGAQKVKLRYLGYFVAIVVMIYSAVAVFHRSKFDEFRWGKRESLLALEAASHQSVLETDDLIAAELLGKRVSSSVNDAYGKMGSLTY